MRAAVYYRYSSDKKAQVENSEARQKSELVNECLIRGWDVVWCDGDKETSGDAQKPKLQELREKVESNELLIDLVYVSSWDRLTRKDSLEYSEDVGWIRRAGASIALKDKGSKILNLHDNQRLLLLQMEVYAANQYLKDLAQKVNSGLTSRFKRGDLGYARAPFGYDKSPDGKTLIPNQDLPLVKEIFTTMLRSGVVACIPIMQKGAKYQANGKIPTTSAVKTVLRNAIYIGKRTFGVAGVGKHDTINGNKTTTTRNVNRLEDAPHIIDVSDSIPPVIDVATFNRVQAQLDANRRQAPRRSTAKYPLSGKLKCANCGSMLVAEKKVNHVNYVCPKSKNAVRGCPGGRKTVREADAIKWFRQADVDLWKNDDFHARVFDGTVRDIQRMQLRATNQDEVVIDRIAHKKKKLDQLVSLITESAGDIDMAMVESVNRIRAEIKREEESLQQTDGFEKILELDGTGWAEDDIRFLLVDYLNLAFKYAGNFVADSGKHHRRNFIKSARQFGKDRGSLPLTKILTLKFVRGENGRQIPTFARHSVRGRKGSKSIHIVLHTATGRVRPVLGGSESP